MLVGRPQGRGPAPIEVDQRIVAQGLDEDRRATGSQHPGELRIGAIELEVVNHAGAADQVEAVVGELELLRVHDPEVDLPVALPASSFCLLLDRNR